MSKSKNTVSDLSQISVEAAAVEGADIYLYNGPIVDKGFFEIVEAVAEDQHTDRAILLITTYGGDAEPAYRIARWFQRYYKEFILCPTSICASAGTLLAMGATSLYMSPLSELGPLDVQLSKRNELGERKSGLITKAALDNLQDSAFMFWQHFMIQIKERSLGNISFEKCAEIASNVCGMVFSEMYRQVNPDILGQDDRELEVAAKYGKRLASKGHNISKESIDHLVRYYPSHNFVIDDEETATLFDHVSLPSVELTKLIVTLGPKAILTQYETDNLQVSRVVSAPEKQADKQADKQENQDDKSHGNQAPEEAAR